MHIIHNQSIYIIENVSVCPPTPSPHPAGAHLWWGKGPDGGPDGGHDGGHHFLKNEKNEKLKKKWKFWKKNENFSKKKPKILKKM